MYLQLLRDLVERGARLHDGAVHVVDGLPVRRHERAHQARALLAQLLALEYGTICYLIKLSWISFFS